MLKKIRVLGTGQTADAEDLLLAKQKLRAVHASVRKDERVRWTIQTLPEAAEEPYVLMASFLAAPEFGKAADPMWLTWGEREITALAKAPRSNEPTRTEYF
ncbi:hypothetical protein [Burkholderia stagnalis]|uniref:hypothetical protein n=1 Tax=Burkholderia stagnalis TaxID=1503054 RepID=UPI0012D96BBD|nr:hypothetical protein [Burkholderia stagnalis]